MKRFRFLKMDNLILHIFTLRCNISLKIKTSYYILNFLVKIGSRNYIYKLSVQIDMFVNNYDGEMKDQKYPNK